MKLTKRIKMKCYPRRPWLNVQQFVKETYTRLFVPVKIISLEEAQILWPKP